MTTMERSAAVRLTGYAATLLVVFAGAYTIGGAVVPEDVVADWSADTAGDHEGSDHVDR